MSKRRNDVTLAKEKGLIDYYGALDLTVRATMLGRRWYNEEEDLDRDLVTSLQRFLLPEYTMFAPAKAASNDHAEDENTVVTKVREATMLSRDDYTVLEELRQLKKQLKKELFSGYLLASLA